MIRLQAVALGSERTWTVLGDNRLPVPAVEMFLEDLRQQKMSPNTVRAYAKSLQLWLIYLDVRQVAWADYNLEHLSGFLGWLRFGVLPNVTPLHPMIPRVSDATAALRLQGVRSFYRYHEWRGMTFRASLDGGVPARARYKPMMHHLSRSNLQPRATIRVRRRRRIAPVLTPKQIDAIKDDCAHFDQEERRWVGSVRDRLFFTLLEETGLRLGEALSLQHQDWKAGAGENPYIEVTPRDDHPLGARVKGNVARKLYISDELDQLYSEWVWQVCDAGLDLEAGDIDRKYVFVNLAGPARFAPTRPETIYKLVARIKRHLGNATPAKWSPHWFRHTHATALLLSGRPIHVVSRRLGHADVQTTLDIYAWVTEDEELRSIADWKIVTQKWREADEKA